MTLPSSISPASYLPSHLKKELDIDLPIGPGGPKALAKLVQERLYLGGYKLAVDGDFGPATAEQLKNFQQKSGLASTGKYGSAEHDALTAPFCRAIKPLSAKNKSLGELVVGVARQHVAQKPIEVGGDNRGPWVRMYMDGNEGEEWKWCAGFCFFAILQACELLAVASPMKKTFTVDTIVDRAKAAGQFLGEQQAKSPAGRGKILPGSLFVVRASATHWSHVGIVAETGADAFTTLEGNTNDDGSANGFEAIERVRGYKGKDFVIW